MQTPSPLRDSDSVTPAATSLGVARRFREISQSSSRVAWARSLNPAAQHLTLHFRVKVRVVLLGDGADHPWQVECRLDGKVLDDEGTVTRWDEVSMGLGQGIGRAYPDHDRRVERSDCKVFRASVALTPDECPELKPLIRAGYAQTPTWTGWVRCVSPEHPEGLVFHWSSGL